MTKTKPQAKHTPGPWALNKKQGFPIVHAEAGAAHFTDPSRMIAQVHGLDEQADANARLIAAAPDLFEAALKALTAIVHTDEAANGLTDEQFKAQESLRAAIAKAEAR